MYFLLTTDQNITSSRRDLCLILKSSAVKNAGLARHTKLKKYKANFPFFCAI
jgi:hypothetical protein